LLEGIDVARYDMFALMHTKKSPHMAAEEGEFWRRDLLAAFAGTPDIAAECVAAMKSDAHIGLIGAKAWRSQKLGGNGAQYERLLDILGVQGANRDIDYISGSMFMLRASVAARLVKALRHVDFEDGTDRDRAFYVDGQIEHGVERAVPALVREMGYQILYR